MTEDQATELLIVLKHINENLAEIAGSANLLAMEDMSMRDKVALSVLNGFLSDGDYNEAEKMVEAAREIGNVFMEGSDG
jgi:hypothetical protein